MKWRLTCFFAWILIIGSIVFELKFTGRDPDDRQIIALVFCGSDLAVGAV